MYLVDLNTIDRLISMSFFQSNIKYPLFLRLALKFKVYSKDFGKVWHQGLSFRLHQSKLIECFTTLRYDVIGG